MISSPAVFGPFSLFSNGGDDIYVVALNTIDGSVRWARNFGGPGNDSGESLIVDPSGTSLFVTGYFSGTANFGSVSISSIGGPDIFLARLDTVTSDVVFV